MTCGRTFCLLLACAAARAAASSKTVLVFGDSWGDLGPSYREVQDTLDRHGFPATVKSAAEGGTSACQWAGEDGGMSLVNAARSAFPDASDGPDYVWYTLGGNDLIYDKDYSACAKGAKTWDAMMGCLEAATQKVLNCTGLLLENYWRAFPKSRVMQSGYDVPCENLLCDLTLNGGYDGGYCGHNHTCINVMLERFHAYHIGSLSQMYPQPSYTGINILGTVQKAAGVEGADVGRPVLTQGGPCQWEVLCIHPKYGTPAATAVGDAFWDLYFSGQTDTERSVVV